MNLRKSLLYKKFHHILSNVEKDTLEAYKELRSETSSTYGYFVSKTGYARSLFRDFESYLRIVVGLDEDDIKLILKQYNSNFVTYGLLPGIYRAIHQGN